MKYCLGTVQFGADYGIQGGRQPRKEKVYEILTYAIEHGIGSFDTAPAYGNAEEVLGEYFRDHAWLKNRVSMISKLSKDVFDGVDEDDWAKTAILQAEASIKKLGIKRLEGFLLHDSVMVFNRNVINALCEVKRAGLTDRIGVSIYEPDEAMKALEYSEIDMIQIPYNVFDRRLDRCGFFDKAIERGKTVYARSSLLQGLLLMDPNNLPDRVSFTKEYITEYLAICKDYSASPLETAIGYVSARSGINFMVFGVDSFSQLKEYLTFQDFSPPDEMIARLDDMFSNVEERVVNPTMWQ